MNLNSSSIVFPFLKTIKKEEAAKGAQDHSYKVSSAFSLETRVREKPSRGATARAQGLRRGGNVL